MGILGEVADAAITWLTPPHYIRDVLWPAIREGMADKIKPLSTAQMAKRYASGELNPHFRTAASQAA